MTNCVPVFLIANKEKATKVIKIIFVIICIAAGLLFNLYYTPIGQSITNYFCKPITSIYFNIIKVLAMPLMFCFIFCSFADDESSIKKNRYLIVNVLQTLVITATVAILTGIILKGINMGTSKINVSVLFELLPQIMKELIPSSVTELIDGGHPLQLLITGGLLGIVYKNVKKNKETKLLNLANEFKEILLEAIVNLSRFIWIIIGLSGFALVQGTEWINTPILIIIQIMLVSTMFQYLFQLIRHKRITHESFLTTCRNLFPSWRDGFITTSSTATIPSSLKDLSKYGISGQLLQQGRCLSKPGTLANYIALIFYCTTTDEITLTWCLALLVVTTMLSFCIPPVSGGFNVCLTVLFTMLGVDLTLMPIAIAVGALFDPLRTASNVLSVNYDIIATEKKFKKLNSNGIIRGGII